LAFVVPTFNLDVHIYSFGTPPPGGTPRVITVGQLRSPQPTNLTVSYAGGSAGFNLVLLLPALTDIRDPNITSPASSDYVEVPVGLGLYYRVTQMGDIAKGFANEHRFALLTRMAAFPFPWPCP